MPQIKIEPIALTPDTDRHELKTKATKVVFVFVLWRPFGLGLATKGMRESLSPLGSLSRWPAWGCSPF